MTTRFLIGDANADLAASLARFPTKATTARSARSAGATAARAGSAEVRPSCAEARAFLEMHGVLDALPLLARRGSGS